MNLLHYQKISLSKRILFYFHLQHGSCWYRLQKNCHKVAKNTLGLNYLRKICNHLPKSLQFAMEISAIWRQFSEIYELILFNQNLQHVCMAFLLVLSRLETRFVLLSYTDRPMPRKEKKFRLENSFLSLTPYVFPQFSNLFSHHRVSWAKIALRVPI